MRDRFADSPPDSTEGRPEFAQTSPLELRLSQRFRKRMARQLQLEFEAQGSRSQDGLRFHRLRSSLVVCLGQLAGLHRGLPDVAGSPIDVEVVKDF